MDFEFNPFELLQQSNVPIKSITVASNLDWFAVPTAPLTGESVVLEVSAKTDVAALKVFGTGSTIGTPSMRSLLPAHIPNIEITQVNGLQSAINSLVKSFVSGHASLVVSNNGAGAYTITPTFGTIANSFAVGNDTRFPASVTGLRKGAGVGSLDIPAVARTDYWDTSDFIASGASHRHGLVPDPGAVAGTVKFLREDGSWQTPAGTGTVTNIATTAPITGGPITTTGTLGLNVGIDHAFTAAQTITVSDAGTSNVFQVLTLGHNSSATPVAGFGTNLYLQAKSSTTIGRILANIQSQWTDPADATRTSKLIIQTVLNAAFNNVATFWGSGGLSVNNTTDPGAGIVSATNFKGSGLLSTLIKADGTGLHVAAVAKTDYWDLSTFGPVGVSHAIGLVPDPGAGSATGRFLNEDGTWKLFTPAPATITVSQLATQASKTLLGNATGGTASPTAVDAKTARSNSLLNLEAITTFGNADYTAVATDRYIATSATFTTTRKVTLPLANTFNPSQQITISDDFGAINGAFLMQIGRQGSDTIQGSSAVLVMDAQFGSYHLTSDGVSKWFVTRRNPSIVRRFIIANQTYTTPTGVKSLFLEGIAGGGGGAGAIAIASNCSLGGGGGAGGYASKFQSPPLTSYVIVVGAPGAGGIGAGAATAGTDTTIGGVVSAQGGGAGSSLAFATTAGVIAGGGGGGASSGDILTQGSAGQPGLRISGTVGLSGGGGGTIYGPAVAGVGVAETNGNTGVGYGAGGGGAISYSTNSKTGGAGLPGLVIITEYY